MSFLSRSPWSFLTRRVAASVVLACMLATGGAITGAAQDATPEDATCEAPDVAEGEATPDPGEAEATPDMATPVAADLPEGEDVQDEAVIDELSGAVSNLVACYNSGDGLAAAAVHTEEYLVEHIGTDDLEVAAETLELQSELGTYEIVSLDGFTEYEDGSYGVNAHVQYAHQLVESTMVFVEEDGFWKLDQEVITAPSVFADTTTLSIEIADEIVVLPGETGETDIISLYGPNALDESVYIMVVAIPDDFDVEAEPSVGPEAVLDEDDLSFVGAEGFGAGDISGLYLQDLPIGTYAVYGFVGAEEEASLSASFVITEPVDYGLDEILGTPEATPED